MKPLNTSEIQTLTKQHRLSAHRRQLLASLRGLPILAAYAALTTGAAGAQNLTLFDQTGTSAGDRYGASVAASRDLLSPGIDGQDAFGIGVPGDGAGRVDAHFFDYGVTPPAYTTTTYALPSNPAVPAQLVGSAVAMFRTSSTATSLGDLGVLAGAPGDVTYTNSQNQTVQAGGRGLGAFGALSNGPASLGSSLAGPNAGDALGTSCAFVVHSPFGSPTTTLLYGAPEPTGLGYILTQGGTFLSRIDGPSVGSLFGSSLETLEDLNGDGINEFIVGAPGAGSGGRAYIYSGLSLQLGFPLVVATVDGAPGERLGVSVGNAGDVNGDGVGDYWLGCPDFQFGTGRIRVFSGSTHTALYSIVGANEVGAAGGRDINGDGVPDLVLASQSSVDLATVHSGIDGSQISVIMRDAFDDGSQVTSLALGDINGDRRAEVIIGQGDYGNPAGAEIGRAQVIEIPARAGFQFCFSGEQTAAGEFATLRASGSPEVAVNDLTLELLGVQPSSFCLFLVGDGVQNTPVGSALGQICAGGAVGRFPTMTADSAGTASVSVDLTAVPRPNGPAALPPGTTLYFQVYHRDADPNGALISHFSPAVQLTLE